MTERLHYTDAYAREFHAQVVRIEEREGRPVALLDRTAFYATSGGQPFDTGTLNGTRVVDVIDTGDGEVAHVLEAPIEPGVAVRGAIDWERRFDHMQQHTGQHVLSAAFDRLLKAQTESFHLGLSSATIDLVRDVNAADIQRAEDEANRIVWENRPVHVKFADAAEAAALPLRKEPARKGLLRLIDVDDFDLSACGGTHVARTGAIGIIAVASSERFRGGTRVEFVCGGRALRSHRMLRDVVSGSVRALSVLPGELAASIERLQTDARDARREIKTLQGRLAAHEAAALVSRGEAIGAANVIVAALEGWDAGGLAAIASAIVERNGQLAVLFGSPAPSSIVVARSADLTADCAALLRCLTTTFGGKGGGRSDLAQGGGLHGPVADMVELTRGEIRQRYT